MTLKHRAIHATIWSVIERVGAEGVRLSVTVILARLLLPEQYGLIAMLFVFLALVNAFMDSGLGSALVQKEGVTSADYSSVFYFNMSVGLAAYILFFFLAPLIAAFYNEPKLVDLTRFMSLSLIVIAGGMVQGVILERDINFKVLTKVSFLSLSVSGILAIYLASRGAGVWSIAIQSVVYYSVRTTLLWLYVGWRPGREFSLSALKPLYSYGYKILGYRMIESAFQNVYTLLIGKYFGARELGYFTQARNIQESVTSNLVNIVERVTFPVMARIQDDDARLKFAYKRVLQLLAFLNFPVMLGILAIAHPLVRVMFGDRWLSSVPYIQLLSAAGAIYAIQAISTNVLKAKGRSDLVLKLVIFKKAIALGMIFASFPWGVKGILAGFVIASGLGFLIDARWSGALIAYPLKEQVRDILPPAVLSLAMALATYLLASVLTVPSAVKLVIQVPFAVGFYFLGVKILRLEALSLFFEVLRTGVFNREEGSHVSTKQG